MCGVPTNYCVFYNIQAGGDHDLAVKFFVMAAEVAIACGDPTEAKVACQAVTQVVDDRGAADHLTLLDQASYIPV